MPEKVGKGRHGLRNVKHLSVNLRCASPKYERCRGDRESRSPARPQRESQDEKPANIGEDQTTKRRKGSRMDCSLADASYSGKKRMRI